MLLLLGLGLLLIQVDRGTEFLILLEFLQEHFVILFHTGQVVLGRAGIVLKVVLLGHTLKLPVTATVLAAVGVGFLDQDNIGLLTWTQIVPIAVVEVGVGNVVAPSGVTGADTYEVCAQNVGLAVGLNVGHAGDLHVGESVATAHGTKGAPRG